jgi:hypothetical protein
MWSALRDMLNSAKDALGVEVPAVADPAAVTDAVTGASQQAGQVATDAVAGAATDVAGDAAETIGAAGEAATTAGEQLTSRLSDLLGRVGG